MPKRGKDRRSDRDQGFGPDSSGGLNSGDEDYDWIRYLGDGRSSSESSAAPSGAPAAPTANLPRRDLQSTGLQSSSGGSSWGSGGGSRENGSGGGGGLSRRAESPAAAMTGLATRPASYADSPSRPAGGFPAGSAGRETTRVADQSSGRKIDFDDYAAPLYSDQGSAQPAGRTSDQRWLDSDVYSRPLYDTGTGTAVGDRRQTGPHRSPAPSRPESPDWLDHAAPSTDPGAGRGRSVAPGWPDHATGPNRAAEPEWAAQASGSATTAWPESPALPDRASGQGRQAAPTHADLDVMLAGLERESAPSALDRGEALDRRSRTSIPGRHGRDSGPDRSAPDEATGPTGPNGTTGSSGAVNAYRRAWPDNIDDLLDGNRTDRPAKADRAPDRSTRTAALLRTQRTGTPASDDDDDDLDADTDTGLRRADTAKRSAGAGRTSHGGRKASRKRPATRPASRRPSSVKDSASSRAATDSVVGPSGAETAASSLARATAPGKRAGTLSRRKTVRLLGRLPRKLRIIAGSAIVVLVVGVVAFFLLPTPTHVISAPDTLGGFVVQPTLAQSTAQDLKQKIIAGASGEVKNVVAAVYEKKAGPGTSTGPQVMVFIGGNLTGGMSATSLISAYKAELHGAFTTSAGKLGGLAACAPGQHGGPSECAWADSDTFGVVVSASLSANALAVEMRSMRPLVEHTSR